MKWALDGVTVSIPYRYYKNWAVESGCYEVDTFQFLIGTIKTKFPLFFINQVVAVSIPYRYYKNEKDEILGYNCKDEFQFLIGTIKTISLVIRQYITFIVSIPYRYYKNRRQIEESLQGDWRFNSL